MEHAMERSLTLSRAPGADAVARPVRQRIADDKAMLRAAADAIRSAQ
jgi:hypothetical protein